MPGETPGPEGFIPIAVREIPCGHDLLMKPLPVAPGQRVIQEEGCGFQQRGTGPVRINMA